MGDKKIIRKAALVLFEDKKVMLARSKKNAEVFYMLGGKFETGESDEECLRREVKEEIGCEIVPDSLEFLHEFSAPAHGAGKENILLVERVYKGQIAGKPTAQSEVAEIRYFNSTIAEKHLTPMSEKILSWLKRHDYIV